MKKQIFNFNVDGLKLPIDCMKAVADEICTLTQNLVYGNVENYDGEVYSKYDSSGSIALTIVNLNKGRILNDIQDDLGAVGGKNKTKLEFFLTATELKDYKCRLMFAEHGLGGYPVNVILEKGIADEIAGMDSEEYVFRCENMSEFEELLQKVINTDYVHAILQSIITESLIRKRKRESINNQAMRPAMKSQA